MSENLVRQKGTLECTVTKLNIRGGSPSTEAPIIGSLKKGETVVYFGYVENGTSVRGISRWYKGKNNDYYWGGGINANPAKPNPETTNPAGNETPEELSDAVGTDCANHKTDVEKVQSRLKKKGLHLSVDGVFGPKTKQAIISFQRSSLHFRNPDGRVDVGGKTWKGLNDPSVSYTASGSDFNTKYKDVVFQGSVFPDKPIHTNLNINLNAAMKTRYLPAMQKALAGATEGMQLLCTIMASHEGFYEGSRSYRTNNPGNIGNTDVGANVSINSLEEGIALQKTYITRIVEGKNSAYPLGKKKSIPSYYSPEIAKNPQYGLPAWLPGYEFVFTGQLDQFVKIYSTGARAGNSYLSTIISYLNEHGMQVNPQTTIAEIIA